MGLKKDELGSLTRRDPLAFGITYIDLLEDKQWEVKTRQWATEIYATVNPWLIEKYPVNQARQMVVTKSTQAGISTMALVKAFHLASNWSVRIGYTLPRQQDTIDFVTTRADPAIESSPYMKDKLGNPNSTHAKRIGKSYIFFIEMSTEPRMMPLDALFVDEVDLSNPDNLATVLNRLDASRWKLQTYLSTPTVPNYGIHGLYSASDMREWLVKCPKCSQEQPIDWEVNLRIVGPQNKPERVFYGCGACNAEITVEHMQTGRWVAQHPDLSKDLVGFHIHQMLTTPADALYKIFRDPRTTLIEFYRKRLGKPMEIGGGSVERDDFLANCFDLPYEWEDEFDGESTYYLGADQGNEIQVVIGKREKHSRRLKIVHVELIPITRGFDRLAQLMDIYHVKKAVGDGSPNRHAMLGMVKKFPGKFMMADYIEQKYLWLTKKSLQDLPGVTTNVTINRTTGFDGLMESIKEGLWAIPGSPPNLHPDAELLIDHVTALKRDIEVRKTPSGETQVAVYRKLRADHLAHSMLYLKVAAEVHKGRNMRVAVIGKQQEAEEAQEENPEGEIYTPDMSTLKGIIWLLAEVPIEQLLNFLENNDNENYVMPFPLSFKYPQCNEKFEDVDIRYAMSILVAGKSLT
jgi:hypothetical protein